ncbi:MAG TPA: flagellar assembly protein FliX [Sphingomonas sp.]|jgi:hypothetical protein|nr:flagellar assembly protein FliX [Sphingomonas sp.]
MRIDGSQPILPNGVRPTGATRHDARAAFPEPAVPPLPPAAAVAASAGSLAGVTRPATSVDMLIALAAMDGPADRRRRAAASADKGLSMLERLRDALAAGAVPPGRLRELEAWADGFAIPDDPALAGIAREIELRVRVEVAKAERDAPQ